MADVQSDLAVTNIMPSSNVPAGMVLAAKAEYIVPAANGPGNGDMVEMVPVPAGAIILDVVVTADNGTAVLSLDVGDEVDPDRFLDGVVATGAVLASLLNDGVAATVAAGTKYTEDDTVDITFLGAAPTAAHVYTMLVTYMMDV